GCAGRGREVRGDRLALVGPGIEARGEQYRDHHEHEDQAGHCRLAEREGRPGAGAAGRWCGSGGFRTHGRKNRGAGSVGETWRGRRAARAREVTGEAHVPRPERRSTVPVPHLLDHPFARRSGASSSSTRWWWRTVGVVVSARHASWLVLDDMRSLRPPRQRLMTGTR